MTSEVVVIVVSAFVIGAAAIAIIHNAVRARRPPRSAMEAPKLTAEDQQQQIAEAEAAALREKQRREHEVAQMGERQRKDDEARITILCAPFVDETTRCVKCAGTKRTLKYVAACEGRYAIQEIQFGSHVLRQPTNVYLPAEPEHIAVTCGDCGYTTKTRPLSARK